MIGKRSKKVFLGVCVGGGCVGGVCGWCGVSGCVGGCGGVVCVCVW